VVEQNSHKEKLVNLIVLKPEQFVSEDFAELDARQSEHVIKVLKAKSGDVLRVGRLNGNIGSGLVVEANRKIRLQVKFNSLPPLAQSLEVVIALPRPKVIKRMIECLTSVGVKKITFINSARVEKYYWDSDLLLQESWSSAVDKGLEQSLDTQEPTIRFERFFKPFVQDQLGANDTAVKDVCFAHPYSAPYKRSNDNDVKTILIGPEGGWVDFEIEIFKELGFNGASFGTRPLKTETFIPFLVGQLLN
jgi:16S rRNA (uracil1498-N3)-methyltransferase